MAKIPKIVDFQFDKSIPMEKRKSTLNWTEKYLEVFFDPVLERQWGKCIGRRFISKLLVELAEKRMKNITLNMIKDTDVYFKKFHTPIFKLHCIKRASKIGELRAPEAQGVGASMLEYFKKFGWLTEKQISFIDFLITKVPDSVKDEIGKELELSDYTKELMINKIRSMMHTSIPDLIEKKKLTQQVQEKEVKDKFMSLNKIRQVFLEE